jgi:RNA polymerase sigma-70 factor, ECF subfamily
MLTEDATIAMPPLASWFGPRDELAVFLAGWPLSGDWRWGVLHARANGQPALGFYSWDAEAESYLPFALNVLTLRGARVKDITAFVVRTTQGVPDRQGFWRWVDQPAEAPRVLALFERFGLPDVLRP